MGRTPISKGAAPSIEKGVIEYKIQGKPVAEECLIVESVAYTKTNTVSVDDDCVFKITRISRAPKGQGRIYESLLEKLPKDLRPRSKKVKRREITDYSGQRFGRLTAIEPTDEYKNGRIVWKCQCDCGNTHFTLISKIKGGFVKSCGCLVYENQALGCLRKRFKTKDEAVAFVQENFDDINES